MKDLPTQHPSVRVMRFVAVAAVIVTSFVHFSCTKDDESPTPAPPTPPQGMYIADTVHYADNGVTAYNIVYTSTDPYGQPAMLSAAIVLGDDIVQSRRSRGFMLYNHQSVFRADECPTHGSIDMEKKMVGSGLITVSADYYGFGISESQHQAYTMPDANAQASIDALIAAKRLLEWNGYTWDDNLFVGGYSQGGQTVMGVVKLVAEHYPDIHITYALAGAGPYDLPATYNNMVQTDTSSQPSTVVEVMLAHNQYYNLGIQNSEMFQEPLLSHIDDWVLSKQWRRVQIDSMMGVATLSQFLTPAMMDLNSDLSRRMLSALDHSNLCQGWTPRGTEQIMLFHNTSDLTVPPVNIEHMNQFLQQHGVEAELYVNDYGASAAADGHTVGAVYFALIAVNKIAAILEIQPWSIL
ncbi:MAG: hypothetical protein IKX51_07975 [Bacteroidales bacterium]|nr:hypothetical protein [Bacteroidales bacterium]